MLRLCQPEAVHADTKDQYQARTSDLILQALEAET